jgi:hypothetical protein
MPRFAVAVISGFLSDMQALQAMRLNRMVAVILKLVQFEKELASLDWALLSNVGTDVHKKFFGEHWHIAPVSRLARA